MASQERSFANAVVQTALAACHRIDTGAKLVSMNENGHGVMHLRIRAGDAHTVASLQQALQQVMPLSHATVTESWIDGTLEADVTVLTREQEYRAARKMLSSSRVYIYWLMVGWALVLVGIGEWAASVRGALLAGKDEL